MTIPMFKADGSVLSVGSLRIECGSEFTLKAALHVIEAQRASVSDLQANLGIGYGQAAEIMEELQELGIVSRMHRLVNIKPAVDLNDSPEDLDILLALVRLGIHAASDLGRPANIV